ncbi:MAG: tRNA guanosine(15) transglycosylase TgtA [Thaumarchaeota archaeon]|nr:tRNA guanosine(15) transglycosylase TgtA [Nitrososphaerota archaeon]
MDFEIKTSDLAGRIGHLTTGHGVLETPALLPVLHPTRQKIPAKQVKGLGFTAVMTNAYLARKYAGREAEAKGIHGLIGFDGIVMTDSGGYQVLEYGDVKVTGEEITRFQETIGVDIATILDQPTGLNVTKNYALKTVEETVRAAKANIKLRNREDLLWMGPIQGGQYLDLLKTSANQMKRLSFNIFALGSPTEVMESYDFPLLIQMICAVKQALPPNKPLHLFGAGHPLTIPLAVSLGCDMFDSASYALYAKQKRYMTPYGTERLENLAYLPCSCPVCYKSSVEDLRSRIDAEEQLAFHNLYVLRQEVLAVRQAIHDGRLWEYLGIKARCHPKLWEAYQVLNKAKKLFEEGTPVFKNRALFLFTALDAHRPELSRTRKRITNILPRNGKDLLLILPDQEEKPFLSSEIYSELANVLGQHLGRIQVFFLIPGIGLAPVEISDIYPLSQHLYTSGFAESKEVAKITVDQVEQIVKQHRPKNIMLIDNNRTPRSIVRNLRKLISRGSLLTINSSIGTREAALQIAEAAKKTLEEPRHRH